MLNCSSASSGTLSRTVLIFSGHPSTVGLAPQLDHFQSSSPYVLVLSLLHPILFRVFFWVFFFLRDQIAVCLLHFHLLLGHFLCQNDYSLHLLWQYWDSMMAQWLAVAGMSNDSLLTLKEHQTTSHSLCPQ